MSTQDRPQDRVKKTERVASGSDTTGDLSICNSIGQTRPVEPDSISSTSSVSEKIPAQVLPSQTPRIWALPTFSGSLWTVCDAANPERLVLEMETQPPAIFVDQTSVQSNANGQIQKESATSLERTFRICGQESMYSFLKRTVICGSLFIAGIIARKLPGELKILDAILIGGSILYFGYSCYRYGGAALKWHHRRIDARRLLQRSQVISSAFCDRLVKALELRAQLTEETRGASPDAELLDTNAYRKLIQENVISAVEFAQLGQMIDAQVGFNLPANQERKMSEIAQDAGLDLLTAIFYRDLAQAAAEIRLETSVNEVFKR